MSKPPTIIAIDPGANGGFAVQHPSEFPYAIPFAATEGDILDQLLNVLQAAVMQGRWAAVVIEDQTGCVGPNFRVSATAMFSFGRNFGFLIGALQAKRVPIHFVRSQKWQKALSLGTKADAGGKTAWKNKLKSKAQQLYPQLKVTLKTADALLILKYATENNLC